MNNEKFTWYITNLNQFEKNDAWNSFFTNIPAIPFQGDNTNSFYIDGYVLPRLSIYEEYKNMSPIELMNNLYHKYGLDFIHYIKGIFTIILFNDKKLFIFNDRHGLQKYFIYQSNNKFIISNTLKFISEKVRLSFSKENAAIYCLLEHFVEGITLFKELTFSKPASTLIIDKNGKLILDNYWHQSELLTLELKYYTYHEIAQHWKDIIQNYLESLKPKKVTMTLTGGNDSRMVLAGLLSAGTLPNAFTFGNPESYDGIFARKVADAVKLNYHNYFVSNPTKEWFNEYAKKIVPIGNSLINIHRAHRLHAIEREIKNNPDNEMIMCGFMGGDYIKGIIYDDYITAKIMRLWKYSAKSDVDKIKEIFNNYEIDHTNINTDFVFQYLTSLPYFNRDISIKDREFYYLFNVIGSAHDWQDSTIFASKIKYLVNPFMDIDFLEILFSSKYSMMNKDNSADNFFKKLLYPEFVVNLTHILAPQLSNIPYAKKGFYSNNEFLSNFTVYFMKRIWRYKLKSHFPKNFPYQIWMKYFVQEQLKELHQDISSFINIENLLKNLDLETGISTEEGYWHKFTNPINISMNLKFYGK